MRLHNNLLRVMFRIQLLPSFLLHGFQLSRFHFQPYVQHRIICLPDGAEHETEMLTLLLLLLCVSLQPAVPAASPKLQILSRFPFQVLPSRFLCTSARFPDQ